MNQPMHTVLADIWANFHKEMVDQPDEAAPRIMVQTARERCFHNHPEFTRSSEKDAIFEMGFDYAAALATQATALVLHYETKK